MNPKAELAEIVMDHLSRDVGVGKVALAGVISGLARFFSAYGDAQQRRGNWGTMLGNLRDGIKDVQASLPLLRAHGGPGVAAVIELAERELAFAASLEEDIVRVTAGESTNV